MLNIIEEKVGNSLEPVGTGNYFLNRVLLAQTLKSTIKKWDLMKWKSFCMAKDTVSRTNWQPTDWTKVSSLILHLTKCNIQNIQRDSRS